MAASRGPGKTTTPQVAGPAPRTRKVSPTAPARPDVDQDVALTGVDTGTRCSPKTLRECHDDKDLWSYYKATADPYARERLILRYVPLVKFVAGKIGSGLPHNVDQGDLINDGMFGLFDAIEKFDPQRANKFETYAIQRVRGAIYDRLRTLDWIPRSVRTKMKAVDKAHQVLEARLRRTPTDDEVAAESGLTMRELRGVYKRSSSTSVLSLDEHIGHADSTSTLGDMLAESEASAPSDRIEDTEVKRELRKAVRALPEKDRIVITLYYFEGLTLSEIGRVLGVTESRACQLHGRANANLRAHMAVHV
jgi:RNA polymerase sigma factor for flagellar operon FliA